jgi:hypothetical protein
VGQSPQQQYIKVKKEAPTEFTKGKNQPEVGKATLPIEGEKRRGEGEYKGQHYKASSQRLIDWCNSLLILMK